MTVWRTDLLNLDGDGVGGDQDTALGVIISMRSRGAAGPGSLHGDPAQDRRGGPD
jgi:hypothetical protein